MVILKKIFSILIKIGISAALLVFLFRQADSKAILDTAKNSNKPLLLLAAFVFFVDYILAFLRWEMLLKTAGMHLTKKRLITSYCGGMFFNLFLPSSIGGDFVRSADLSMHTKKTKEVVATVFLDRLSGYAGLVILAILALVFGWEHTNDKIVLFSVALITAILAAILFVLFNKFAYGRVNKLLHSDTAGKIREAIKSLHHEIHIFRQHKRVLFTNLMLSIIIQATIPLTFYIIALSLRINIHPIYFFIFLPIISTITLLPISIGGLGLRDATTIFFFARAGVGKEMAFAMSLLAFFFILVYGIAAGLIYVITIHSRRL